MKGNPVLYKSLVVGVIVLFIGVGIQPAFATVQAEIEIDVEPKDYLFQTIIDIANNPDVNELFEQYKYDLFKVFIDRSVYRKIFFRNPRLFFDTFFTKPSMTIDYLDKCYKRGIEITNILGEDKVIGTIENVGVTDTKLLDKLDDIISKDEELSNRLETLKEMNKYIKTDSPFNGELIICSILVFVTLAISIGLGLFVILLKLFDLFDEILEGVLIIWLIIAIELYVFTAKFCFLNS